MNKKKIEKELLTLADFIDVKSYKARGKRLTKHFVKEVILLDPLPYEEEIEEEEIEEIDEINVEENDKPELEFDSNINKNIDDIDDPIQMTLF